MANYNAPACKTHGESNSGKNGGSTQLYAAWKTMRQRCLTGSAKKEAPRYLGRGITICEEWVNDFCSFRDWALENGFEEGKRLSIDRKDNDGNYEPDNCHWITVGQNTTKDQCGENTNFSKLRGGEVWLVRRILAAKVLSQDSIARMFKVKQPCISYIKTGRTWQNL